MQTHDIPDCILKALSKKGQLTDAQYHLAGAGRAIAFMRMAAHALENVDEDQRIAEYQAYTGISAARTSIDATASWLRLELSLEVSSLSQVDLKRKDYSKKVVGNKPGLESSAKYLGELAERIDEHRQRAQHREGLALIFHIAGTEVVHAGGWYLAPKGLSHPRTEDVRLTDLLRVWADRIEQDICSIVDVIYGPIQ